MTNEQSSPALIPGKLPEGLLPPTLCGRDTQQVLEAVVGVIGVSIAAGERGPQGLPGPAGPAATLTFNKVDVTLGNAVQNNVFTLPSGDHPSYYNWTLTDPSDSGTALSPAPAIAYFSATSTANQYRVTFTAPMPNDGWILSRTKIGTA